MKGIFENGRMYTVSRQTDSGERKDSFTWMGGCRQVRIGSYWEMGRYLDDFRVEGEESEAVVYILQGDEARDKNTYETMAVPGDSETEGYALFRVSARIPHGPGEYFETFDDCDEVHGIKVPYGKRLTVKGVLAVDLRTNEYEVPDGYTVEAQP